MSDFFLKVVPAFELLQARYQPEKAEEVYESMTENERRKVDSITLSLHTRKEELLQSNDVEERHPHCIVDDNSTATENIGKYFQYLGYRVQLIPSSVVFGNPTNVLILEW